MACGTPSIYSNCSGQLEFAKNKGLPVKISHELPVSASTYNHFNDNVGNYYEPDFEDLSRVMKYAYENYESIKKTALIDSEKIRKDFNWENVAKIGLDTIKDFLKRHKSLPPKPKKKNEIIVSYLDGPRVEVLGDDKENYLVEFINSDTGEVIHSQTISNNMWTAC
jgi:translation initiation factor 2 alpha subunit (eIF-2alpha)